MRESEQTDWEQSRCQGFYLKSFTKAKRIIWFVKSHTLQEMSSFSIWWGRHFSTSGDHWAASRKEAWRQDLKLLIYQRFTMPNSWRKTSIVTCQAMDQSSLRQIHRITMTLSTFSTRPKSQTTFIRTNELNDMK